MKTVYIKLSEEDFKELKELKEKLGMTWKGMLKRGNMDRKNEV